MQARFKYEHVFGKGFKRGDDTVFRWRRDSFYTTGKYTHNEYYFETPKTSLLTDSSTRVPHGGNQRFEVYDYPGEYERRKDGEPWARIRMEEEEARHECRHRRKQLPRLDPGFPRFELYEHERRDQNGSSSSSHR